MDIDALSMAAAAEEGAAVDLLHPGTEAPLGITLRVRGYESEAVEDALRAYRSKQMAAKKKRDSADAIAEVRRLRAKAALISVEGGTGGMATIDGVRDYIDRAGFIWLVEQIEAVAGDRASFFTSAETP